ncbi:MAG: DMT family transporter [Okeania sp. SIO3H1]|uniref:DMT family transporter n=1 Tax=Okeania sp. SIO1I7 TaxID=2607772 RepID=UPI0013C87165|nr:DMT family transporter [Okeania sp. SIO1I7]NEN87681.1 DMT family transporter [Okeania sp. SIO3H1]NET28523.1 DMT family transporter [Okeania sp. SIO1I7]
MELWITNFQGELAALTGAFLWAASSAAYSLLGQKISPLKLNLFKGLIAIALIFITLIISNKLQVEVNPTTINLFLISGILGIGLGDTAFFSALKNMGARRTLLMETLSPPMTALLALIFLGEQLTFGAWCGILITVGGVAWVISERTPGTAISNVNIKQGILWAILAATANSSGAVISRFALLSSDINPLLSTLFRLIGGTIIVVLLLFFQKIKQDKSEEFNWSMKLIGAIFITAFSSTYLGIWLQQTSLKFSPAGIAQTLLATSPIFIIPIAAQMGEKISIRSFIGVLVAVVGVSLLFTLQ